MNNNCIESGQKKARIGVSASYDIDAKNELEGRIEARRLVEENTSYNIEFITLLSDQHLEYEKESGAFEITEF